MDQFVFMCVRAHILYQYRCVDSTHLTGAKSCLVENYLRMHFIAPAAKDKKKKKAHPQYKSGPAKHTCPSGPSLLLLLLLLSTAYYIHYKNAGFFEFFSISVNEPTYDLLLAIVVETVASKHLLLTNEINPKHGSTKEDTNI